jgi:hypothetical protein
MHDQGHAIVEIGQKIFRATSKAQDRSALKPLNEICGKGKPKVGPPLLYLDDPGTQQRRLKATPPS